jgi:S-(hydroxymethyl)glutathione dehydrogenase / alcohol dehydrogenase
LAKEFGATEVLDAGATDTIKAIREMTGGGVEDSFECVGSKTTVEQAFRMLRCGGTATVIGMMPLGTRFEVSGAELLAMGTNKFHIDMPRLVDFYLRGDLKLDRLILGRIQLAGINEAFKQLETGEVARTVIAFWGGTRRSDLSNAAVVRA